MFNFDDGIIRFPSRPAALFPGSPDDSVESNQDGDSRSVPDKKATKAGNHRDRRHLYWPRIYLHLSTFCEVIKVGEAFARFAWRAYGAPSSTYYSDMLAWSVPVKVGLSKNPGLAAIKARLKRAQDLCLLMLASVRINMKREVNSFPF